MLALIIVYYNNSIFRYNKWNLIRWFETALTAASCYGHTEIVKLLLEQEGIDVNAKAAFLFDSEFISFILDFKEMFGIHSNYWKQLWFLQLWMVTLKLSNCFLNIKELISTLFLLFIIIWSFIKVFGFCSNCLWLLSKLQCREDTQTLFGCSKIRCHIWNMIFNWNKFLFLI